MANTNYPTETARGHVSGESIFVDDVPRQPNELLVDFFWSPVARGRIRSLDLDAARQVRGVAALFTHADLSHNRLGNIIEDEPLLAETELSFIGQPIVVIAAETRDAIEEAKKRIVIDIEELTPVLTIEEAEAQGEFIGVPRTIQRGDAEAAIARAPQVLEGIFENGGQDQFYLESQAAIAWPGEHGTVTILSSTQNPTEGQDVIARSLGISQGDVVVTTKRMGGGFGGKECQATHPATMAALTAQRTGRPARIIYSKDEDMVVTGHRHPFRNRYRVGFDDEGRILGITVDLFSDGGAFADLSPAVMARAMCHIDNAYYLPDVRITGRVCRTNNSPNTAMRGFGGPQGVATIECALQEIAAILGKDAYDVRRANCYGDAPRDVTPYGQKVENNMLPRLFDQLVEQSSYRDRVEHIRRFNAESKTTLAGIAITAVKFGISFNTTFLNQASALLNVYLDGSVQVSTGATEMGQGVNDKIAMVVATELGIDPSSVRVMVTSTEKNANTSATAASSASDLNGSAAAIAAKKIRERLMPVAQGLLKNGTGVIVFENGRVFRADHPEHSIAFAEVARAAHRLRIDLGERGFYATPLIQWDPERGQGRPFLYFTNACAVSEVRIDRFTGMTQVVRTDILMDIGRPMIPGIDRGQITGGFVQGLGWCTTEELRYGANGELLTHSPTTYKIPNIGDLPPMFNVEWIVNETNTVNLRGSKAVGEPPLLTAISVWCAIKHALGFVAKDGIAKPKLPATCEEILLRIEEYERAARATTAGVA
ncbi:MAG: xanthine dehydrogenase molybdopterin binding subunit [Thermoanaerobaculia bacterium]